MILSDKKTALFLPAVLLLVLFLRLPTFFTPIILSDEAYHSMRANVMLSGGELYRDIIDRKPPLIPLLYALSFLLFGKSNLLPVHILATCWVMATALAIFHFSRTFFNRKAAVWAVLIYAVSSHSFLARDFHAANRELFMILPLILASHFFLQGGKLAGVLSGAMVGIGFLFKQPAGIQILPLLIFLLVQRTSWRFRAIRGLHIVIGFLLTLLITALVFWKRGTLGDVIYWLFTANYYYITQKTTLSLSIQRGFITTLSIAAAGSVLWYFGIWECTRSLRIFRSRRGASPEFFCSLWFLTTIIPVVLGFRFFPHYYLQLYPPLGILAGIRFSEWVSGPRDSRKRRNRLSAVTPALVLIPLVFWMLAFFPRRIPPEPDYRQIGDYIVSATGANDRIFVWGNFAEIYWYTKRNPATRLYNVGLVTGLSGGRPPDIDSVQLPNGMQILLEDFARTPPVLIIDIAPARIRDQHYQPISDYPPIANYLKAYYYLETVIDDIHVYRRKEKVAD